MNCLAVVGVGLLGSSVALAARKAGVAKRIVGVDRLPENLATSVEIGAIDQGFADLELGVSEADLIVLAVPVDAIVAFAPAFAKRAPSNAAITDVGSTKRAIVAAFGKLPEIAEQFVGAHPMAGSEKSGPEFASANLFQHCSCAIVATETSNPECVERIESFWQALGCKTFAIDAAEHDLAVAYSSHLPHLAANALALAAANRANGLVGSGLLSMTRLAAGSPAVWRPILEQNHDCIVDAIDNFCDVLQQIRATISARDFDGIERRLHDAASCRSQITASRI